MFLALRPVTMRNRDDLETIDPGPAARAWVHSNWYWHQQSLDNPTITFRLIHALDVPAAVGMVAFGPAYADEALTQPVAGAYELIHLVIDARYHRQGLGRIAAQAVLQMLMAQPDCARVVVAHHPDNLVSRAFFGGLGFRATDRRNYDGDPLMELTRQELLDRSRADWKRSAQ